MADNLTVTPGTGATLGADDITDGTLGEVLVGFGKIMDGTLGGTNKAAVTSGGALKTDASATTQPVSAASLPLPTGAAQEAGGNLATIAGTVSGGKVLTTETSAAASKTDLDSIVTNTGASATSANQTNGTQQTKLTDGTNTANVVAGDTGFNGVAVASATKTYTFTTSTAGVQTLGPWNCEGFSWVEVVYTSVGTGLALTGGQFSTASGGAYVTSAEWFNSSAVGTAGALGVTNSTIYSSSIHGNYFQIAVSALTSGTFTGTVTLRATPPPVAYSGVNASQTGNWTVGSNSATGSAFPANAFGQGVKALTASPAAATTGNLVAVMGNTMGMPVIAQSLLNSPIAVSASITVVKNAPGYLSGILVTSAGTSTAMTFYDNASAASGTIIGIVPATATAGTFWPFNMPALAGITASGSATNPAVTVAYA